MVGGILQWFALAAPVALLVMYVRRARQVRVRPRSPGWLEPALAAWALAAVFGLSAMLDGAIGFSHTVGGLVGAAPLLWWAEQLRRTA